MTNLLFHLLFLVLTQDPPVEINDTYRSYQALAAENLFVKWPSRDSMPPGDYEEYNNTNMMGAVSCMCCAV